MYAIWRHLPRFLRNLLRPLIHFGRRLRYGWNGIEVSHQGALFYMGCTSRSEVVRAQYFPVREGAFTDLFAESALRAGVIYDIGANTGIYTVFAGALNAAATVYSFEPDPGNFQALLENIKRNKLNNIIPLEYAIGERDGFAHLDTELAAETAGASRQIAVDTSRSGLSVKLCAIDTLVRNKSISPPDIMKIDIDGFELKAVMGMEETLRVHGPELFIEVHPDLMQEYGDSWEALDVFMESVGYKKEVLREPGENGHRQYHARYLCKH